MHATSLIHNAMTYLTDLHHAISDQHEELENTRINGDYLKRVKFRESKISRFREF